MYARHDWTAAALCALRIPLICEFHYFKPSAALRYLFREASRGRPIAFVAISSALANLLVGAGCPASSLVVAHDGVDLERFTPSVDRTVARTRLGLPHQPTVCHVGHLYPGRGVETLLECAARLRSVLFLFVGGTAADVDQHRARAAASQLSNVRFVGDVANADVPLHLYAADVLAMPYTAGTPTHRYMSPMKLFEYLAAGRPIVASDFPVLHEVLTSGGDAIFVPASDPAAFVAAIERVLSDDVLAAQMGEFGRRTASRYTWTDRQRRVLDFATALFKGLPPAASASLATPAMNTVQLTLQRHAVPVAAIGAATCAALLAGAALALDEPRIVVGGLCARLVVVVSQLSDAATIRLLIVVLAVQGFPAYFTGYFPAGTLFADDAAALVLIVGWLARSVPQGPLHSDDRRRRRLAADLPRVHGRLDRPAPGHAPGRTSSSRSGRSRTSGRSASSSRAR